MLQKESYCTAGYQVIKLDGKIKCNYEKKRKKNNKNDCK